MGKINCKKHGLTDRIEIDSILFRYECNICNKEREYNKNRETELNRKTLETIYNKVKRDR